MNRFIKIVLVISILFNLQAVALLSNKARNEIVDIDDFKVHLINNDKIDFMHAELIVLYNSNTIDPVIPFISARTAFTDSRQPKSPIAKSLRSLGNDYNIEFNGDYFVLKLNFLRRKFPEFIKFLSVLFKTNSLYRKDLNYEKRKIIRKYKFDEVFQRKMALFAAYKFMFKDKSIGNNFFTMYQLKKTNINRVIVHYKGTFTPANSRLFLMGKINKIRMIKYISDMLKNVPKGFNVAHSIEIARSSKPPNPIILNIHNIRYPTIIYLKIVESVRKNNYISNLIINDILFKQYPVEEVLKETIRYRLKKRYLAKTEIYKHRGFFVINNSFKINYNSIRKFLSLLNNDIKMIKTDVLSRRSYKIALNYYYGKKKIETGNYEYDMNKELESFLFKIKNPYYSTNINDSSNLLLNIKYELKQAKRELQTDRTILSKNEAIVIIGDLDIIMKYYPEIKGKIVDIE